MKRLFLLIPILFIPACNRQMTDEDMMIEAKRIHARILTIDSHTDTPLLMMQEGFDVGRDNSETSPESKVDLVRMQEGGLDAAFFAVFVGQGRRDEEGNAKARKSALSIFDTIYEAGRRYSEMAEIAWSAADAYRIEKEGKRAIFIGLENGYPIGTDIQLVQDYYDRGARYITLCHTENNDICDSSTDESGPEHYGLSSFGKHVVAEMNRLGIMVDISHASDASFYDVLKVSAVPVLASHSCARAICNNPRNLDDDMLRALADNGGVIQMCILSSYVEEPPPNPKRDSAMAALGEKYGNWNDLSDEEMAGARKEWQAIDAKYPQKLSTVSKAVDHIDHIVKIAGIDHVGIGTDFDGGGGIEGCNNVSEMGNITVELYKRGYSEEEMEKIWGKNLLRVMREVEQHALGQNPEQ